MRSGVGDRPALVLCYSGQEAARGADALAIVTEWQEFRSPDFDVMAEQLAGAVVFDGRNLYEPDTIGQFGLRYYAIGRGAV